MQSASCKKVIGLVELEMTGLQRDAAQFEKDFFDLENFERSLEAYISENPSNGDDDAFAAIKLVRKTLNHLDSGHKTVNTCARKLVVACRHNSFEVVVKNAKKFRLALKAAEQAEYEGIPPEIIPLHEGEFFLEEIRGVVQLINIGKELDNCVDKRKGAVYYLDKVKSGKTLIYVVTRQGRPMVLFEIDADTRKISEFCDGDGRRLHMFDDMLDCHDKRKSHKLSRALLNEVLRKLGAKAEDRLVQYGVFDRFADGIPVVEPIVVNGRQELYVWPYRREIIIGLYDDDRMLWSRFTKDCSTANGIPEWEDCRANHMSLGNLAEIVIQNPEIAKKLQHLLCSNDNDFSQEYLS